MLLLGEFQNLDDEVQVPVGGIGGESLGFLLEELAYAALAERYAVEVIPNWHESFVATSGPHRIDTTGEVIRETYPPAYWPGETLGDHLEFALKYDGTNLAILSRLASSQHTSGWGKIRFRPLRMQRSLHTGSCSFIPLRMAMDAFTVSSSTTSLPVAGSHPKESCSRFQRQC